MYEGVLFALSKLVYYKDDDRKKPWFSKFDADVFNGQSGFGGKLMTVSKVGITVVSCRVRHALVWDIGVNLNNRGCFECLCSTWII